MRSARSSIWGDLDCLPYYFFIFLKLPLSFSTAVILGLNWIIFPDISSMIYNRSFIWCRSVMRMELLNLEKIYLNVFIFKSYLWSMIIWYQLSCYLHTWNQSHLLSASLAIPSFAINSLASCFACSWPHLHSGLTCYPAPLAIRSIFYQAY